MARTNLTHDDKGKRVVNSTGDEVGMISEVEGDMAYVDPDPGITDTIRSKLGWEDKDQEDYVLEPNRVDTVTDDEVRLSDNI